MASSDLDTSGITLIKRAITLDTNKRYAEALVLYREGIELLMDAIKSFKMLIVNTGLPRKLVGS